MGRYHARDVVRVPGLLSLARVPLAAVFPLAVERAPLALMVLAAAGLSDVLDGWYARRYGQVSATGSVLDPITDKLFVTTVAVTLVVTGHLTPLEVVLLSTREIGELPLVVWLAWSHAARSARAENTSANVMGKLATALQFVSVAAALFRSPHVTACVGATAAMGVLAALSYWLRAIRKPTTSGP